MNFKFKWFSFKSSALILILSALCVSCGGGLTEQQKQAYHALKGDWVFSHFHIKNSSMDANLNKDELKTLLTSQFTDLTARESLESIINQFSGMTLSFNTTKASVLTYTLYESFAIEYRNENLVTLSTSDGQNTDITYHIINGELHTPNLLNYLGIDLDSFKDFTGEFPLVFKKK